LGFPVGAVESIFRIHTVSPEMTSLLNQSGLNFQNGNPLGRKVRALESDVETLKKELQALKSGGVVATTAAPTAPAPSVLIAELDALKRDLAILKMAGFGKGEKGDKGEKGEKGDPGPMTYIAMPANASLPPAASVVAPASP
jgi:hypothetical protein